MIVRFDLHVWTDRRIGQHEIQLMHGKFGEQTFWFIFSTNDMYGFGQAQSRFQNTIGDKFGNNVSDPNKKTYGPPWRASDGASLEGIGEFSPERENFLGVTKHHTSHFG